MPIISEKIRYLSREVASIKKESSKSSSTKHAQYLGEMMLRREQERLVTAHKGRTMKPIHSEAQRDRCKVQK